MNIMTGVKIAQEKEQQSLELRETLESLKRFALTLPPTAPGCYSSLELEEFAQGWVVEPAEKLAILSHMRRCETCSSRYFIRSAIFFLLDSNYDLMRSSLHKIMMENKQNM
jgi:hypothetical protein